MNRNKYPISERLHAWVSEKLLRFLGSLWVFQGGIFKHLQTYHEHYFKRVRGENSLPTGSDLHLECTSFSTVMTYSEFRKIHRKLAKNLFKFSATGYVRRSDYSKIMELFEKLNSSSVHSKTWAPLGLISFDKTKTFLELNVRLVDIELFSLSKGHVLISFKVHFTEAFKNNLNEVYFKKHFWPRVRLYPSRKGLFKYWGASVDSGTIYKQNQIELFVGSIKERITKDIHEALGLPYEPKDFSYVDLYRLKTSAVDIFNEEFWYTIPHNQNSSNFFEIKSDDRFTMSVPSPQEGRSIVIVAREDKFTFEKSYVNLESQIVSNWGEIVESLLPIWTYHTLYFDASEEVAHLRFKIRHKFKWFGIGLFSAQSNFLDNNFNYDMLSKDFDIRYFFSDLRQQLNFEQKHPYTDHSGRLADYLSDGIEFFKGSYAKSREELLLFMKSRTDMVSAVLNLSMQFVVVIFTVVTIMITKWENKMIFEHLTGWTKDLTISGISYCSLISQSIQSYF